MSRMPLRIAAAIAVLAASGCGEPPSGPRPGLTYFWRLTSSENAFVGCTDDPDFREQNGPIEIVPPRYLIYQVADDGKTAVTQDCPSKDVRSCQTPDDAITFTVAGSELLFSAQAKRPIGDKGCHLSQTQSWTMTDQEKDLDIEISYVLSLVDSDAACESLERSVKAQSPNNTGLQGCTVIYKLGAQLE